MKPIKEIKRELKEKLTSGISDTLPLMKKYLSSDSKKFNDFILIESEYKEAIKKESLGLVGHDVISTTVNRIRKNILHIIDDLEERDVVTENIVENTSPRNYKINKDVEQLEYGVFRHKNGKVEIKVRAYDFFGNRLSKAFPGVRQLKWFNNPQQIVKRLEILLREPITFDIYPDYSNPQGIKHGKTIPLWWFRGYRCLHIEKFKKINETKILLNECEFEVCRIAVYIDSNQEFRSFLYVETKPEPAIDISGKLDIDRLINEQLEYKPFASQEYGFFKGSPISLEEYMDGATIINGEVVELDASAERRTIYLTPYNFIICAVSSIFNSPEGDTLLEESLNKILQGKNELESFLDDFLKLSWTERPRSNEYF